MRTSETEYKEADASGPKPEYREGPVAKAIEEQTAKLPSDIFLWGALGSMGISIFLELSERKNEKSFFSSFANFLLILGVYNKLVKLHGSDGKPNS
jgi:hypothetical protein